MPALSRIGIVTFEDPETGRQVEVDTTSRKLRERFRAAAAGRREGLVAEIRSARAQLLEISTAEPVINQLIAYLRVRQAMRGGLARRGVR